MDYLFCLPDNKGFIPGSISTKCPQCPVIDITNYFIGLREGIANTLLGKFPGTPEGIGGFIYITYFNLSILTLAKYGFCSS